MIRRLLPVVLALAATAAAGEVTFKKIVLDKAFRAEGVATADVNHDGKRDVLTGEVWYAAPDWKMHEQVKPGSYQPKGYSQCFNNWAADVNGDGWTDAVLVKWPGKAAVWRENPQNKPGHWKEHVIWPSACGETPLFTDLLGTGKPVLVFGIQPEAEIAWFSIPEDPTAKWVKHAISKPKSHSTARFTHGYGVGDVNGDGRNDFVVTKGWWEAPEDRTKGPWAFHAVNLGAACADMIVTDIDADGDSDIITSSAHRYGIWWHEQVAPGKFQQKEFFKKYSQAHAMVLADMNRDGIPDLVTGKRHYAHGGKDPGGNDPAMVYWFEVRRPAKGKVEFILHEVDNDSGIGTQFEVSDINGDGKLDIITSNKKGVCSSRSEGRSKEESHAEGAEGSRGKEKRGERPTFNAQLPTSNAP